MEGHADRLKSMMALLIGVRLAYAGNANTFAAILHRSPVTDRFASRTGPSC